MEIISNTKTKLNGHGPQPRFRVYNNFHIYWSKSKILFMHTFMSLTVASVAIGLAFFLFRPSVCILEEYTLLYLKQIGNSASFIGTVWLLSLVF